MTINTDYRLIPPDAWGDLVQSSPVASWFQTREAFLFFESLSFMQAFVVSVSDEEKLKGVVVGYVQGDRGKIKRKLSSRAIINGGPLLANDISVAELSALLTATRTLLQHKVVYIETRNLNDYSKWRETFEVTGFTYHPHNNFHLDTSTKETIAAHLSRTRKRHIHVGLRDGAVMAVATSEDEVEELYRILLDLYRHKVRKPLPPKEFFLKLFHLPSARTLVIKHEQQVIGGMFYISLESKVGYEWYVCGQDGLHKGLYPSELATYAGLLQAAADGCARFDMMGAGKPGKAYGVRDFKALFGGTLVEHGRFLYLCKPLVYRTGKFVMNMISKR